MRREFIFFWPLPTNCHIIFSNEGLRRNPRTTDRVRRTHTAMGGVGSKDGEEGPQQVRLGRSGGVRAGLRGGRGLEAGHRCAAAASAAASLACATKGCSSEATRRRQRARAQAHAHLPPRSCAHTHTHTRTHTHTHAHAHARTNAHTAYPHRSDGDCLARACVGRRAARAAFRPAPLAAWLAGLVKSFLSLRSRQPWAAP